MNKKKQKILAGKLFFIFIFSIFLVLMCEFGANLNKIVIKNNNLKMPVSLDSINYKQTWNISHYEDDRHFSYKSLNEVNYPILTDFVVIGNSVYSIGDLIMYSSLWLFLVLIAYNIYLIIIIKGWFKWKTNSTKQT